MNISRESYFMTDLASWYKGGAKEFKQHAAIEHTANEYVRYPQDAQRRSSKCW
jgi:hypothetical protein